MTDDNPSGLNRRGVLKKVAGASAGLAAVSSPAGAADGLETGYGLVDDRERNTTGFETVTTTDSQSDGTAIGMDGYNDSTAYSWIKMGTIFHHYNSWWSSELDSYLHEFSISTCASSHTYDCDDTDCWATDQVSELHGQEYEMWANDGGIMPRTTDHASGAHPGENSGVLPDWTEPFIKQGIDEAIPGVGWVFAASTAREMQEEPEGTNTVDNGFNYRNMAGYLNTWSEAMHFHEPLYESGYTYNPGFDAWTRVSDDDRLCCTHWLKLNFSFNGIRPSLDGDAGPQPGDDVDVASNADAGVGRAGNHASPGNSQAEEMRPEEMPQELRQRLGVKRYNGDKTLTARGQEVNPTFVMRNSPFTLSASWTEQEEVTHEE